MGAIAVSIFVTVVAVVGVIYFNRQDRKEMHQTSNYLQKNASKLVTNRFFYYLCTRTIKTEDYDSN